MTEVKKREAKVKALRETIEASITGGGAHGDADVEAALEAAAARLSRDGH